MTVRLIFAQQHLVCSVHQITSCPPLFFLIIIILFYKLLILPETTTLWYEYHILGRYRFHQPLPACFGMHSYPDSAQPWIASTGRLRRRYRQISSGSRHIWTQSQPNHFSS